MTKIIALSGPPRAGKDTIGNELAAAIREENPSLDVAVEALSMPLRRSVYALGSIPYTREHYEAQKDVAQQVFGGATIRQVIIDLAEGHVRPRYGVGFFARSLINAVSNKLAPPDVLIVTDLGFDAEVWEFDEAYGLDNVAYLQIIRPGHGFEGDSRSYVGTTSRRISIINDRSSQAAAELCLSRLKSELGMKFD